MIDTLANYILTLGLFIMAGVMTGVVGFAVLVGVGWAITGLCEVWDWWHRDRS